jgi:hypothetical protein
LGKSKLLLGLGLLWESGRLGSKGLGLGKSGNWWGLWWPRGIGGCGWGR